MCNCRAEIEKVLSQKYTNPIIDYSSTTTFTVVGNKWEEDSDAQKEQMSKAGCRECARRCGGCLHMAVAYGFVKRADVEHLLDCQPFPWPGYSKDWRARE